MWCKVTHCAQHILVNTTGLISCTGVMRRWGLLSHSHYNAWWRFDIMTFLAELKAIQCSSCQLPPQQKECSLPNKAFLIHRSSFDEYIRRKHQGLFKREDHNALVNKPGTLWKHNKLSVDSRNSNYYSRSNCYIYLTAYSRFITPYPMQTTPNHSADLIWSFLGTISLNYRQTFYTSNHACQVALIVSIAWPLRIPDTVLVLNSGCCPVGQTLIADCAGCYVSAVCLLEAEEVVQVYGICIRTLHLSVISVMIIRVMQL